ncbi:MAG: hypothetical protein WD733_06595 [Bryobacterales bacterium]
MNDEAAMIYAKLNRRDEWEERAEKSYDANDLREEYRKLMYSPEAVRMIESFSFEAEQKLKKTGR